MYKILGNSQQISVFEQLISLIPYIKEGRTVLAKEVSEKLEEQVEKEKESLRQLNEQQRSMTAKIVSLSQEYQIATQKAAEAKARADS